MRIVPTVVAVVLAVAACGQKGPLFLRDDPPPGYKPKAEVYKPVPYPADPAADPGAGGAAR
jgi:predicted small lipoprotein YifL